jgi:hypothetical protein
VGPGCGVRGGGVWTGSGSAVRVVAGLKAAVCEGVSLGRLQIESTASDPLVSLSCAVPKVGDESLQPHSNARVRMQYLH